MTKVGVRRAFAVQQKWKLILRQSPPMSETYKNRIVGEVT